MHYFMLKDSDSDGEAGVDCHLAVDSESTSDLGSTDGTESDENDIAFEVCKDVLFFHCLIYIYSTL